MTDLYPDVPGFRAGSPETAHWAAESMTAIARSIEAQALAAVCRAGADGLTSDEIAEEIHLSNPYAARPRVSGLRARNEIVDSGRRRKNASGRSAAVWVLPCFAPVQEGDDHE
jgi:hypothetical protein